MNPQLKKIWGVPTLLALSTLFGLTAALFGTGLCAVLAWLTMSVPLAVIIWKLRIAYIKPQ